MWKVTPIVAVAPAGPDVRGFRWLLSIRKKKENCAGSRISWRKNSSIRKCPEVKKCVGLSCRIMPTRSWWQNRKRLWINTGTSCSRNSKSCLKKSWSRRWCPMNSENYWKNMLRLPIWIFRMKSGTMEDGEKNGVENGKMKRVWLLRLSLWMSVKRTGSLHVIWWLLSMRMPRGKDWKSGVSAFSIIIRNLKSMCVESTGLCLVSGMSVSTVCPLRFPR